MKSLNFNTNPTGKLKEYLLFAEESGYKISLCNLGGAFYPSDEIPQRFFTHDNAYCASVKSKSKGRCVARQKELCRSLGANECVLSACPFGVAEYVCRAGDADETYALVCLTGYRENARNVPEYDALKTELPGEERACAVLYPVVALVEKIAAESDYFASGSLSVCREIKRYAKERLFENLTVDKLCRHVGFSRSYVGREFKKQTGETVLKYLNRLKTDAACSMLETRSYSVADVAERLGFCDANYFSAFFKKQTGISPSEFRQSRLK